MATYTIEHNENRVNVALLGDLTSPVVPDLQSAIRKALDQGALEVIFDLEQTGMMDSSGIGLLVAACNSLTRKNGNIAVINVSDDILLLLQSMRLVQRLNVTQRKQEGNRHG